MKFNILLTDTEINLNIFNYFSYQNCNVFSVLNILRYNPGKTKNKFITYPRGLK